MATYENYDCEGYRFVFKFDDENPDMLHIWARHTKTVAEAVEIWFEGTDEPWDPIHRRFATYTESQGLYWIWLEENSVVMIISCFDL